MLCKQKLFLGSACGGWHIRCHIDGAKRAQLLEAQCCADAEPLFRARHFNEGTYGRFVLASDAPLD